MEMPVNPAKATTHGFADVNGTRLWYESAGAGPPLVLIHGSPLDARMWDRQFADFSSHFRVVRYDVRGYGQSAVPDQTAYRHEEDLAALLEFLGIARASILGQSMGGRLALDFALAYPQAVSALVLVGSSLSGFTWTEDLDALETEISDAIQQQDLTQARKIMLGRHWFQLTRPQSSVQIAIARMIQDYSGWHWLHHDPVLPPHPPAYLRLDELHVPALVMVGEHDHSDIHRVATEIAGRCLQAQTRITPGVGHMLNMEDPVTFHRETVAFLTEYPKS